MASCCLYLAATAGILLAAAATVIAPAVPQAQTVKAAPGTSVRVQCAGSSASGGGAWSLLDTLSNLLLGDDDDDDDDDVDGSSAEKRADSAEDDYYWLGSGVFDDTSSEEAARREPAVPTDVANNSLTRARRDVPSWSLGDIGVQAGKNWSVRVFNWVLVRRNPATDRVEVKLLMPNLFSPGASSEGADVDDSVGARGVRATSGGVGDIDVQGGKNWSVSVFNWVLVRRNPTTGQVEVKLQVPGLYSSPGGGDDDVDEFGVSGGGR